MGEIERGPLADYHAAQGATLGEYHGTSVPWYSLQILDYLCQRPFELPERLFSLAAPHAVCDAGLQMVFEQPGSGLVQRRTDRRELYEQIFTGLLLGQHPVNAADVALNAA